MEKTWGHSFQGYKSYEKITSTRLCTKYSGYLHYLGCNLLVDNPTNGVIDIHGAGEIGDDTSDDREKGYTKGVMHCVLNTETCVRLAQNNVTAKTMKKLQKLSTTRCETMSIMTSLLEYSFGQSPSFMMQQRKLKRKKQITCLMRRFRNATALKRNG